MVAVCARALLDEGADVDHADASGRTPLMNACLMGDDLCARALIDAKANLQAAVSNGSTALMISCMQGHERCVQALIAATANLEAISNGGFTALMQACKHGHDLCARALVEASPASSPVLTFCGHVRPVMAAAAPAVTLAVSEGDACLTRLPSKK